MSYSKQSVSGIHFVLFFIIINVIITLLNSIYLIGLALDRMNDSIAKRMLQGDVNIGQSSDRLKASLVSTL